MPREKTSTSIQTPLLPPFLFPLCLLLPNVTLSPFSKAPGSTGDWHQCIVVSFLGSPCFLCFLTAPVWIPSQAAVPFTVVSAPAGIPSWAAVPSGCICSCIVFCVSLHVSSHISSHQLLFFIKYVFTEVLLWLVWVLAHGGLVVSVVKPAGTSCGWRAVHDLLLHRSPL